MSKSNSNRGMAGRLKDAILGVSRNESLRQLEKRGVRRVNVLGVDRIVGLIEEAVESSLRDRLLRFERTEVADATKKRFLELLQQNQTLVEDRAAAVREKEAAEEAVREMRTELEERQRELAAREAEVEARNEARRADQDDRLYDAFAAAVAAVEPDSTRAARLTERLGGFVLETVQEQRRLEAEAGAAAIEEKTDNLRRRVAKLVANLEESERRLDEARNSKDVDGDGVASIYRSVQGLSREEENYEQKKALMANLFEANLSLQKKTGA